MLDLLIALTLRGYVDNTNHVYLLDESNSMSVQSYKCYASDFLYYEGYKHKVIRFCNGKVYDVDDHIHWPFNPRGNTPLWKAVLYTIKKYRPAKITIISDDCEDTGSSRQDMLQLQQLDLKDVEFEYVVLGQKLLGNNKK